MPRKDDPKRIIIIHSIEPYHDAKRLVKSIWDWAITAIVGIFILFIIASVLIIYFLKWLWTETPVYYVAWLWVAPWVKSWKLAESYNIPVTADMLLFLVSTVTTSLLYFGTVLVLAGIFGKEAMRRIIRSKKVTIITFAFLTSVMSWLKYLLLFASYKW